MTIEPKKILLIRTDRIGDVVLTTPIIKILRDHFPKSHLAFLTRPQTREIVDGNPYLDEIIIYDPQKAHRGILKTLLFSKALQKKKFDVAIFFNTKNRVDWIGLLSKIAMRIGYRRKHGGLLTHTLADKKGEGEKSEAFYNEDLLSFLNVPKIHSTELYFPENLEAKTKINIFLKKNKIEAPYVVINVSTSSPSKQWPLRNFSALCQLLYKKLNLHIILIGKNIDCKKVMESVFFPLVSVAETFSLSELAALLKNALLHISNDTGPMHIASAVGTPVISIFGRSRPGLSPKRWAPLKGENFILQKKINCSPCLADLCSLDYDCLKATKIEEVFYAAQKFTSTHR